MGKKNRDALRELILKIRKRNNLESEVDEEMNRLRHEIETLFEITNRKIKKEPDSEE